MNEQTAQPSLRNEIFRILAPLAALAAMAALAAHEVNPAGAAESAYLAVLAAAALLPTSAVSTRWLSQKMSPSSRYLSSQESVMSATSRYWTW
jgi:hypothetical protein